MKREIEKILIEKAAAGDAAAFAEIYFARRDAVYGFVYRMLRERAAAEDMTQEVFMFLIENPHKYERERSSLGAFLCGVARNKILHYLRKRGARFEINHDEIEDYNEPPDIVGRNPLDALLDGELAEKVEESLARLPPLQREAIILREMHELSCEEIAEITGAEIGAIKVRLHRARKSLAREIAPYLALKKKETSYEMR